MMNDFDSGFLLGVVCSAVFVRVRGEQLQGFLDKAEQTRQELVLAVAQTRERAEQAEAEVARYKDRASKLEDAAFHFQTCREGKDSCESCSWFAAFLRGEHVD